MRMEASQPSGGDEQGGFGGIAGLVQNGTGRPVASGKMIRFGAACDKNSNHTYVKLRIASRTVIG